MFCSFQAAKMCKYTNYQRTCDVLFASFAVTWIVTRLGVYPTWILYSTTIEAPQIVEMFPGVITLRGFHFPFDKGSCKGGPGPPQYLDP